MARARCSPSIARSRLDSDRAVVSRGPPARRPSSGPARQLDREGRPLARYAVDADRPAMGLDDLGRDIETEAEPPEVLRRGRALVTIEHRGESLGGDPDAMIGDHELDRVVRP